jgi:hypothetical protein
MKKLKHPNLVTLIGVCSTEMPMLIVTEFVPHGDMLTYLRRREAKREMTQPTMLCVAPQHTYQQRRVVDEHMHTHTHTHTHTRTHTHTHTLPNTPSHPRD